MANPKTPPQPRQHHYVRTMTAALLGAIALALVSASILLVWANRTLTDTNTYVQTVGPALQNPALEDFVAGKVADQLVASGSVSDLAQQLLTPAQLAANPQPQQQQALVTKVIHDSVVQILKSPALQEAWRNTNETQHEALISQLNANVPAISLDLGPLVNTVLAQMKQTQLAPAADKIDIKPSAATVDLKGAPLEKIHRGYNLLREVPWLVLALALVLAGLSVWASVHHAKTLRRMLVMTGTGALVVAAVVGVSARVTLPVADPASGRLASALVGTLLHGLEMGCLVLGLACLCAALGSKLYSRTHSS